ncbi:hypothetical protein [Nonomuraea wenchangensis]|uniref:hypothetical protein n=1 Tax=Nonomuraea wenchangensis TaxID=568860 RepID=UPI00332EE546
MNGDLQTARRWFDAAYRQAEQSGDPIALALAALGLGGRWVREHRTSAESEQVRTRQSRALSLLDPSAPPALRLRVRLQGEDDYRNGTPDGILRLLREARDSGDRSPSRRRSTWPTTACSVPSTRRSGASRPAS